MEENQQQLPININIFCKQNHYCYSVCIQQKCLVKQKFLCQEPTCVNYSTHVNCKKCQIKSTLTRIQQKHALQYQKYRTSLKGIETIYDNIIQELSNCRQQFLQYVSTFGLTQETVQLIKCLNQEQYENTSKEMWFKVYAESKNIQQNSIYSGLDTINLLKKSVFNKLEEIKKQLKSFQYNPEQQGLKAKTLQQCQQFTELEAQIRIRKFFRNPIDEFKLIYRASDHEFSANIFHEKCDWVANTLFLVKNDQGKVLGGYTPLDWSQISKQKFKTDQSGQSFLFSVNLNQKFNLVEKQKALYCNSHYGPTFGSGFDMFISNRCNKNSTSFANFTKSYFNEKYPDNQQTSKAITGKSKRNEFKVVQYQIFQITWK